ncbi:hypothetical protein ACN47E_001171 [Coniothyrium glycines]
MHTMTSPCLCDKGVVLLKRDGQERPQRAPATELGVCLKTFGFLAHTSCTVTTKLGKAIGVFLAPSGPNCIRICAAIRPEVQDQGRGKYTTGNRQCYFIQERRPSHDSSGRSQVTRSTQNPSNSSDHYYILSYDMYNQEVVPTHAEKGESKTMLRKARLVCMIAYTYS